MEKLVMGSESEDNYNGIEGRIKEKEVPRVSARGGGEGGGREGFGIRGCERASGGRVNGIDIVEREGRRQRDGQDEGLEGRGLCQDTGERDRGRKGTRDKRRYAGRRERETD